jgi:hypothetical protein
MNTRKFHFYATSVIAAIALSWAVAAFLSGKSAPDISYEATVECPFEYGNFRQSMMWRAGGKKLLVEADRACGSKFGHSYELKNVTVTIYAGKKRLTRLKSPSGTFETVRNSFVIGRFHEVDGHSCIGDSELMDIQLRSGEVRAPGLRFFLNANDELPCKKG